MKKQGCGWVQAIALRFPRKSLNTTINMNIMEGQNGKFFISLTRYMEVLFSFDGFQNMWML